MKLEWMQLELLLLERRQMLITALCGEQMDYAQTQFRRGQIEALNWVIDTPHRAAEEQQFESQREKMNATGY